MISTPKKHCVETWQEAAEAEAAQLRVLGLHTPDSRIKVTQDQRFPKKPGPDAFDNNTGDGCNPAN